MPRRWSPGAPARSRSTLAHSDREAISLVARCEERGIRVPDDLAVVAF
ncbi:substrate-binding domain-containing protein, partial [Catellatospora sp. NPDC049133]